MINRLLFKVGSTLGKSTRNRKKRRSSTGVTQVAMRGPASASPDQTVALRPVTASELWADYKWAILAFFVVFIYAYWPTLVWVEDSWRNEPDYSHGYLVPLLAGLLFWHRSDTFPGVREGVSWGGLSLIFMAIGMRLVGRLAYADFFDGWSIVPLLLGVIWFVFGWEAARWSLPPVFFLCLMIPLPYQAETMLSWKLQGVAAELSTVFLRVLGKPAVSEGHVIWLNDQRLLVEQACSGLRIFIGVAALAFFWASMVTRSWVDRIILLASVIPLAVFVNAVRITVVGLLYQVFDGPDQQHTIHDVSGYLMIPLAFGLLWLIKTYWEHLYRPIEQLTAKEFVRGAT